MRYNPDEPPDATAWLELGEADRLAAVKRYHVLANEQGGNPAVHAAIHVAVETQLAEGLTSAAAALDRLVEGGLTRHDALHAIGSVLAEEMLSVLRSGQGHDAQRYDRALSDLTAASWRAKYGG
jgi:uncharacterized protein DUF1841